LRGVAVPARSSGNGNADLGWLRPARTDRWGSRLQRACGRTKCYTSRDRPRPVSPPADQRRAHRGRPQLRASPNWDENPASGARPASDRASQTANPASLSNHSVVKSGLGFGYRLGHSTTDRAELIKDDLDPAGERQEAAPLGQLGQRSLLRRGRFIRSRSAGAATGAKHVRPAGS
jgi:hypothetical protein